MISFRNILMPLAGSLSLDRMISKTGKYIIFPFYHLVSDNPPPHIRNLYDVKSVAAFRRDMDDLLAHFEPISPGWLLDNHDMSGQDKPGFILSFDDGLRESVDVIAPVLEEKGINAIFFLNNHFINNKGLFYRYKVSLLIEKIRSGDISADRLKDVSSVMDLTRMDEETIIKGLLTLGYKCRRLIDRMAGGLEVDFEAYLEEKKPYLDENEIRTLLDKGFYIGAHSNDHPLFHQLSEEEQSKEILNSMKGVKERFGIDYSFFSFPFSDYGVSESLLKGLFGSPAPVLDASFGTSGLKEEESFPHYQRIPLEKSTAPAGEYLKAEYLFYRLKALAGKNRIKRS